MREEKFYKVKLKNVTDEDLELINKFDTKSREVLEHFVKLDIGVLRILYIDTGKELGLIEATLRKL